MTFALLKVWIQVSSYLEIFQKTFDIIPNFYLEFNLE